MQRRILILVSFLAALVLVGCEKDVLEPVIKQNPPVIEPVTKFTVEITSVGDGGTVNPFLGTKEVNKGSDLKVTLSNQPGYKKSLKVNDAIVSLTGDDYVIPNIASNYKIIAIFEKTLSWYLVQGKWKQDSLIIRELDKTWSHYLLWGKPGENQFVDIFLPSHRYNSYINGELKGDGDWSIDETKTPAVLNWGGELWQIDKLDADSLNISRYDAFFDLTQKNDGAFKEKHSKLK